MFCYTAIDNLKNEKKVMRRETVMIFLCGTT